MAQYDLTGGVRLVTTDPLPADARLIDAGGIAHPLVAMDATYVINCLHSVKMVKGGQTIRVDGDDVAKFTADGWTIVNP